MFFRSKMTTTTTTRTFKPDDEIEKLLNSLDPEENDIDKISDVTHKCLMIMSVVSAAVIINNKKNDEKLDNEEEMKLFHELVQKHYLEKIDFMRKELLD